MHDDGANDDRVVEVVETDGDEQNGGKIRT